LPRRPKSARNSIQIGSDPDARRRDRRASALSPQQPRHAGRSHQPLHALTPDADPARSAARHGAFEAHRCRPRRRVSRIRSVSHASPSALSDGARRSQSWKLVRFTPSARHVTETGKFAFSAAISEKISPTARRSPGRKAAALLRISRSTRHLILTTRPMQLLTLVGAQAVRALALIALGLPDPVAQRHSRDPEILRDLPLRFARQANELDRLPPTRPLPLLALVF